MAIADRVAVMSDGTIQQIGRPEELYHQPASPFVARFIGNAMPLAGHWEDENLILSGGHIRVPGAKPSYEIYVREENIRFQQDGPLTGIVESVTFSGGHYRVGLGGVNAGDALLYGLHRGRTAPQIGSSVSLSINANDLIIL
jgi:putative spermidine/putrescine transport system ATP-binding protein